MDGLKISTGRLKNLVGIVSRGAGNNRLLPITSTISIQFDNNEIHFRTTDTVNTFHVWGNNVGGEGSLVAVVDVELFSKLVSKTTSDFVNLSISDNYLKFRGNGTHDIPLLCDEDGVVEFPKDPVIETVSKSGEFNVSDVKDIIAVNKSGLSALLDYPQLCGYYCGERAITTNSDIICINHIDLFSGNSYLLYPETLELLSICEEETIKYEVGVNNEFRFYGTNFELFSYEHEGFEDFPESEVLDYLDLEFPDKCTVSKSSLNSVMDRLNLFIEPYDKNGACLTFTNEGLCISSKKNTSEEIVPYIGDAPNLYFKCLIDVNMLKQLIKNIPTDSIEIFYGNDSCIKISASGAVLVIALLVEESGEF